jgi:hypothetical protein
MGQFLGDGAGVVARVGRGLLIGRLVLLVDDDQAKVGHRGEEGGARADDDRALAGSHQFPLGVAFGVAERGVEDGDLAGEAVGEAGDDLRGERDLGHEDERLPPGADGGRRRPQVDLGLAGAGDAVQEEGGELPGGDRRRQRLPDARLLGGERRRSLVAARAERGWLVQAGCAVDLDQPLLLQAAQDGAVGAGQAVDVTEGH